jgi:hypothetical protein
MFWNEKKTGNREMVFCSSIQAYFSTILIKYELFLSLRQCFNQYAVIINERSAFLVNLAMTSFGL